MKLDPGMHIGMHLVFFGKSGVTHTDTSIIFTFGSLEMFFYDSVFSPSKTTHVKAPPHHCIHASATPLLHLAGDLPLGGD
jgi:hypothetical protein